MLVCKHVEKVKLEMLEMGCPVRRVVAVDVGQMPGPQIHPLP